MGDGRNKWSRSMRYVHLPSSEAIRRILLKWEIPLRFAHVIPTHNGVFRSISKIDQNCIAYFARSPFSSLLFGRRTGSNEDRWPSFITECFSPQIRVHFTSVAYAARGLAKLKFVVEEYISGLLNSIYFVLWRNHFNPNADKWMELISSPRLAFL